MTDTTLISADAQKILDLAVSVKNTLDQQKKTKKDPFLLKDRLSGEYSGYVRALSILTGIRSYLKIHQLIAQTQHHIRENAITPAQVRDLYNGAPAITREGMPTITTADIHALIGDHVDTDDDGVPTDDMWEVLANQVNS